MRHGTTRIDARRVALGLLLWLAAPAAARADGPAPLPDDRLGTRTVPLLLLSRPDVRDDLKLTPAQAESAERAIADLYAKAAALKGRTGPEAVEARRAIDGEWELWVHTELSTEQRGRLGEIDLQWEGPSALVSRPGVATALGLDDKQRQALEQAVARRDALRKQGKCRPEDERVLGQQALATLTAEQRATWKGLLGEPFTPRLAATAGDGTRR